MEYNEIKFDSKEEVFFLWFLQDMKKAGFIDNYKYQPVAIELTPKQTYKFKKVMKTKEKIVDKHLLHPYRYTADFEIHWNTSAKGLFYENINEVVEDSNVPFFANSLGKRSISIVDTKASYNLKDSNRRFSSTQKVLFLLKNIYVQQIVPQKLFEKTFTPNRYLMTDKGVKLRTIHFKIKTLKEYIDANI